MYVLLPVFVRQELIQLSIIKLLAEKILVCIQKKERQGYKNDNPNVA